MIKTYILYSYGMVGYRTYLVRGEANEAMNRAIPDSEMPRGSVIFFGKQDYAKMLLRHIDDEQMTLFIEKVPSPHKDPLGRNIPCSIQFVGDAEKDGDTLRRLAVHIGSDLAAFGAFFQTLISDRGGLHISGDQLRQYIDKISDGEIINGKVAESILTSKKESGVEFLSPYSNSFTIGSDASRQVMDQLNLSPKDMENAIVIPAEELGNQLNLQDEAPMPKPDESSEKEEIERLNAVIGQRGEEIKRLTDYSIDNEKLRNKNEELSQRIRELESSDRKEDIKLLRETVSMYKREYENIMKKGKILLLVTVLSIVLNIVLLII